MLFRATEGLVIDTSIMEVPPNQHLNTHKNTTPQTIPGPKTIIKYEIKAINKKEEVLYENNFMCEYMSILQRFNHISHVFLMPMKSIFFIEYTSKLVESPL